MIVISLDFLSELIHGFVLWVFGGYTIPPDFYVIYKSWEKGKRKKKRCNVDFFFIIL